MSEPDLTAELDAAEVIVMGGAARCMAAYVAPAARVLTFLHRPDPDGKADLFSQAEHIYGWTRCGLPFKESELWVPVEYRDGDPVCPACCGPGRPAEDVQEALL